MAIVRPVTKTLISVPNWGVPITDEVNRLTDWQLLNTRSAWGVVGPVGKQTVGQSGIGSTLTILASLQVLWTAVANRYYRATVSGLMFYCSNAGIVDIVITDSVGTQFSKQTHSVPAAGFLAVTLSAGPMTFPAGQAIVQVRAAITTGSMGTNQAATAPAWFSVEDCGPV